MFSWTPICFFSRKVHLVLVLLMKTVILGIYSIMFFYVSHMSTNNMGFIKPSGLNSIHIAYKVDNLQLTDIVYNIFNKSANTKIKP